MSRQEHEAMSDNEIYPKWVATGVGGHRYNTLDEYLYTSDAPPVEYDEYVRTLQRAEAAEAERDQLLSHLADADQSSMERIAKIDALEAALAAVLPDFYREVCAEAERIIESSGMVSGAHWNAMKIILERRGVHRRCSVSANHPPE